MLLQPVWEIIHRHLFSRPAGEGLFNPYADRAEAYDVPDAIAIRRDNFRRYLRCYRRWPRLFLLAEAPGPWGCRFSGVPLVCEAQLVDAAFPIRGRPSSRNETPHSEYTARIYWRVLGPYFPHFFTWNSVPFHPFRPGHALSIRNPRRSEVAAFTGLLQELLGAMRPERILAIGRNAEYALGKVGAACTYVRHPSQGGAKRFEAGVHAVVREMGLEPGVDATD